jgi:hypothetical protein
VYSSTGLLIADNIKGSKPEEGMAELKLDTTEVIVSASVDVDRLYPVNFKFMIFDAFKSVD